MLYISALFAAVATFGGTVGGKGTIGICCIIAAAAAAAALAFWGMFGGIIPKAAAFEWGGMKPKGPPGNIPKYGALAALYGNGDII
jgi:hypothetical protein